MQHLVPMTDGVTISVPWAETNKKYSSLKIFEDIRIRGRFCVKLILPLDLIYPYPT